MKKTALIGVLLIVIMANCAMYTRARQPEGPENEIAERLVAQIDSFTDVIAKGFLPAVQNRQPDTQKLRELFLDSRLAYKKFEWAAEYFTPATSLKVNGPPVPEGETNGTVLPATGLQVIEADLYPQYDPARRQEIVAMLRLIISECGTFRNYFHHTTLSNGQVWDAAKQEVFRVLTLGITGFDAPLAKSGLGESACSLRSLSRVLAAYPANGNVQLALDNAVVYLEKAPGFDNFDRAVFITRFGNPLTTEINRAQHNLNLAPVHSRRLLKQDAATLFDAGAFDASVYSAYPEDSPTTNKIALGKKLFFDPSLSGTGTRSCASCHRPEKAFTDGMMKNTMLEGGGLLKRNTPTLLNAAFQPALFDDLRETSLEGQARDVIESKPEMHGSLSQISTRLSHDTAYLRLFAAAYPDRVNDGIGRKEILGAIAHYVRTLAVLNSRFDSFMRGNSVAMNAEEVNGFNLFMGKARCGTCHYMPLFNGALPPFYAKMEAEVIGVPADPKGDRVDADRGRYSITYATVDDHAFKTPTVRNASKTAPYMHNGVFTSLEEVIDFYDNGGGAGMGLKIPNQTLSAKPLKLTEKEKKELIAFINSLDNL